MAQINGRITICDRCGEKVFSKTIGEGETDGGYTRWNKFEPLPDGWESHWSGIGMLCPKCNKEYKKIIDNFLNAEANNGSNKSE